MSARCSVCLRTRPRGDCAACAPKPAEAALPVAEALDLWEQPAATDPQAAEWQEYTARNPHLLPALATLARERIKSGARRVGMKALFEQLRWDARFRVDDAPYKLNNDWTPWATRALVAAYPEFDGVFETRRSAADGRAA